MPRLTTQALALSDAYRASGAPITMPRRPYQKRARKAYNVWTKKHWHTYKNPRTGETQRYFEWGDAVLHGAEEMTLDAATAAADYLASAGFAAWIFIYSDDRARIGASSEYSDAGSVAVYDLTVGRLGVRQHYHVDLDPDRKRAAWQRANER